MINTADIPELSKKEYRKFGLTFAVVITLIFGLFFPWAFGADTSFWPWAIAAVLLAWALITPDSLRLVYRPWMRFAHVLGLVNTRLILGLIFFVVFTPLALLFRLSGRDPLDRRIHARTAGSLWKTSAPYERKDMENLY